MYELYENIKKRRIELGMTQDELAKLTGYTDRSSIAKIESGKVDLTRSKILIFADVLKVSPADLMGWQPDEGYYTDPDTADLAQKLLDDPDMRVLFDAAMDSRPEDLQIAADLLKRLKGTNPNG